MYRQKAALLGTGNGILLRVAFVLIVFKGAFSSSSDTSYFDNSVTFPNCTGSTYTIGNGYCSPSNNNAECGYDGGDCCECTCEASSDICDSSLSSCLDPEAGHLELGCKAIPPSCVASTPQHFVVGTTADAYSLADSIFCTGGTFIVEWTGYVSVNRTLFVVNGTILDVIGASGAVADGGGTTQLFLVFNGKLRVSDVEMSNGFGINGGAISATRQSEVTLSRVSLTYNTANGFGGAIRLDTSFLELVNSSTFTGNSAAYGGAIHMAKFSSLVANVGNGEIYRFADNTATDGGALYVYNSLIGREYPRAACTSSNASSFGGSAYYTSSHYASATKQYTSDFDYSGDSYSGVGASIAYTSFINNSAQSSGGAIYIGHRAQMYGEMETIFEGNSAENGGALFVMGFTTTLWREAVLFAHNSARTDGGAAQLVGGRDSSVELGCRVRFLNNTCGGSGGAIALLGTINLDWWNNAAEFSGNSADLFGGAIYVTEAKLGGYHFSHARFTENQAKNGGAVYALKSESRFSSCTFVGNSALVAGGAVEIVLGEANVCNTAFIGNFASDGGALTLYGTVELLNLSFFDNHSGEGGGSAISNAGTISEMTGLSFSANKFVCVTGEYMDTTKSNTRFSTVCKGCYTTCDRCFVEDNTSVPTCTKVFRNAKSINGTATIEGVDVDPGYWRASNRSTHALRCYNAGACLGGLTGYPGYCSKGYEGPYCSVCSKGYGKMLANSCSKCSDGREAFIAVALATAVLAVLASVWHMVSIEQEGATQGVVARFKKILPLQSIKITTVVWQIVTQFSSVTQVIYPEAYQRLLEGIALVNFDMGWVLSAGCIVDVDFHDGLLVATVGPMAVMALLGMTYVGGIHRNRGSKVALHAVRRKHLGATILLTFFIYSSVSSVVFRTFACDELDDGIVYLRTDYRIECDSPRHKAFQIYASLMVLVYPVGIPLFYTALLFREHNLVQGRDDETPRDEYTSILRLPYRPPVFYYEVVECSRRILLTGVVVFIYPNTVAQIAVAIMIAFTFVLVSEGLSPYACRWDTWVSRAGHIIVFLSMYIALLLRVDVSNESLRDQNTFAGLLVAAHMIMIILVVVETITLVYSLKSSK